MTKTMYAVIAAVAITSASLAAQWPKIPDPTVPRKAARLAATAEEDERDGPERRDGQDNPQLPRPRSPTTQWNARHARS